MYTDINKFMQENRAEGVRLAKTVLCKSGLTMSIQASEWHYCQPRENSAFPYSRVEIGFPNQEVKELMQYAEDYENPTDTVYGYVPVEVVEEVIKQHGGIVGYMLWDSNSQRKPFFFD